MQCSLTIENSISEKFQAQRQFNGGNPFPPQQQQQVQTFQQQTSLQPQQFQGGLQATSNQQPQALSQEELQSALKNSLQSSLQQEIINIQQSSQFQTFPPDASVPQTNIQTQLPEHIRNFQQDFPSSQQQNQQFISKQQQSSPPFTVFADPSTAASRLPV